MSALSVCAVLAIPIALSFRQNGESEKVSCLKNSHDLHWRRRAQHVGCGLVIAATYQWFVTDLRTVVVLLCLSCVGLIVLNVVRSRYMKVNDVYMRVLGPLLRPSEINGLPGSFWFLLGSAIAIALFPKPIAVQRQVFRLSCKNLLHLSVGDPAAAVVGISRGSSNRFLPGGKSIAGTIAAFVVCALGSLSLFIFLFRARTWGLTLTMAGMGGICGAVAEVLPLGVDDNLCMPVVSGLLFLIVHRLWFGSLVFFTVD
ncbi:unnamed protein product [Choristocarpus tenellus]